MKKALQAVLFTFLSVSAFARGIETLDPNLTSEAQQLDRIFARAGEEFGVPADLLRSIAYVESRWTNHVPVAEEGAVPPSYGGMGLRDADWFGPSPIVAVSRVG